MLTDMLLGLLLLLALSFTANANTACYNCNGTADPSLCHHVVQCPAGQQCHIRKISTGGGSYTYNMGCASNKVCTSLAGSHAVIGRRQSVSTECNACCNSAHCNRRCCNGATTLEACCREAGYIYDSGAGICIKLFTTPLAWPAAEETCTGDNAHLLIVWDLADFKAVGKHFNHTLANLAPAGTCHRRYDIWVGANDMEKEGVFRWWNGHALTTWQKHTLHSDDASCDGNTHGADCVLVTTNIANVWNDRHCDYALPFVCQMF